MTNVKKLFNQLVASGKPPKDAAKEIQQRTGLSAVNGKPINKQLYKSFSKKTGKVLMGQYDN